MSDNRNGTREPEKNKAKAAEEEKRPKRLEDYDPEMQKRILAEIKRAERNRKLLILAFVVLMICGFGGYGLYYMNAGKGNDRGGELSHLVGNDVLANIPQNKGDDGFYTATIVDESGYKRT
ncbi:MAG: hypothetical protein J6X66_11070, partial [Lachnospiraceae bacterium]|nr:hypothetical protein [Lachnospiraceae bacterium]